MGPAEFELEPWSAARIGSNTVSWVCLKVNLAGVPAASVKNGESNVERGQGDVGVSERTLSSSSR